MSDGLDYTPTPEEVWPPSPTLPPPEPVRLPSFMARHPVLARLLMSVSAGIVGCGVSYSQQWFSHHAHVVYWDEVWTLGVTMVFSQLLVWFGIPYMARREVQQRERKGAALEAGGHGINSEAPKK